MSNLIDRLAGISTLSMALVMLITVATMLALTAVCSCSGKGLAG